MSGVMNGTPRYTNRFQYIAVCMITEEKTIKNPKCQIDPLKHSKKKMAFDLILGFLKKTKKPKTNKNIAVSKLGIAYILNLSTVLPFARCKIMVIQS